MKTYFYARVSTDEQCNDRQLLLLSQKGYEVPAENIYQEKGTGTKLNRPVWRELNSKLNNGDTVIVESLSRIARNTVGLMDTIYGFDARGIKVISFKENFDMSTPSGKLMVGMFSVLAQFERDLLSERVKEGLKVAKANGKKLGREKSQKYYDILEFLSENYCNWDGNISKLSKKFDCNIKTARKVVYDFLAVNKKHIGDYKK